VFGQGETNSQIRFSTAGFPAIEQLVRFANESLSLRSRIRNPSRGRGAFEGEVNGLCSTFLWELTARFQISVLRPTSCQPAGAGHELEFGAFSVPARVV